MSYEDISEFSRKLRQALPQAADGHTAGRKPNRVRSCIRWRAARSDLLGRNLFYDPAWDILLCLYAAHMEGIETDVETLMRSVDVPRTVLSRWLTVLEERGLISGDNAPFAKDASIRLTDTGLGGMHALCEVLTEQPMG